MNCRHCNTQLEYQFLDLGLAPLSNGYLNNKPAANEEKHYPLKVLVCSRCWLVQTEDFVGREEMFTSDYAYFSSVSSSWLSHIEDYVTEVISDFDIKKENTVVEVASNDGYLLQFVREHQINCYGIEPTQNTADSARKKGIKVVNDFFSVDLATKLAGQNKLADLMIANNVLAHVPDINDFVKGFTILLKPEGIATFEFPHIVKLVEKLQFDTVYHEHYSYLSLYTLNKIFEKCGLEIFDVAEIPTHGGSLRVFAQIKGKGKKPISKNVDLVLKNEIDINVNSYKFYKSLQSKTEKIRSDFLNFLVNEKSKSNLVVGYGAAAKGNTLLNYSGVGSDLIQFVCDAAPSKQNKYLPGSHIPIVSPESLKLHKPKYVVIFPWNIASEVISEHSYVREWGGRFVTVIPSLKII